MHYANTAFDFLGNCQKKERMLLLNHHIFLQSNKNKVLLIFCSFSFFFLKDKKLNKLAVALKLLAVISLNSNVSC